MTDVLELNSPGDLDVLRPTWHALLEQTPGADFFHTPEWLEVYLRHYGRGQRLRVLLVKEDSQTIGILPLVERPQQTRIGKFRALSYPLDDWGSFYRPIGPNAQAILTEGLAHLLLHPGNADFIELGWADTPEGEPNWVVEAFTDVGMRARRRVHTQIPMVDLSGGWDAYWASRSANCRSNSRRNEKRLARAGRVEYFRFRSAAGERDMRWDLYQACEDLSARSWQGESTTGTTLCHESVRPFLRDVHEAAVAAGAIDINLLSLDDYPIAYQYNYVYRGCVSGLRLGYDSEYARCGAGTVLMFRSLADSCQRGDHTVDMLPGSLPAKKSIQTVLKTSYRYTYCPSRFGRIQLLRLKRWLDDWRLSAAQQPALAR